MDSHGATADAVRRATSVVGIGTPLSITQLPVGMSNAVFDVALVGGGRVVARVSSVAKNRYAMETRVMERVRLAGIPCPEIYGVQEVGDLAVMLIEYLPGVRLAEAQEGPNLAGTCGEMLARVHSIGVTGVGNLASSGNGESDSLDRWFVDEFEPSLARAATAGDDRVRRTVEQVRSEFESARPALRAASCGLVHGDYSPSNILVHGGQISGVIDWESAKGGPAAFDFGWWDWFEAAFSVPFTCNELIAAYGAHRAVDVDELREMRRLVVMRILIGQVAWAASRDQRPELQVALRRLEEVGP
ncbi:MAG TPA: aminoglycoside phosphotransferase family protein [Acidimicrobiales bacterium]|nr:aminoglycoside phosphotransferase family protein [Acidimicrobiales bacterium]